MQEGLAGKDRTPSQVQTAALPQASFSTLKVSQMALSQYWGTPYPNSLPNLSPSQVLTGVLELDLGPQSGAGS